MGALPSYCAEGARVELARAEAQSLFESDAGATYRLAPPGAAPLQSGWVRVCEHIAAHA